MPLLLHLVRQGAPAAVPQRALRVVRAGLAPPLLATDADPSRRLARRLARTRADPVQPVGTGVPASTSRSMKYVSCWTCTSRPRCTSAAPRCGHGRASSRARTVPRRATPVPECSLARTALQATGGRPSHPARSPRHSAEQVMALGPRPSAGRPAWSPSPGAGARPGAGEHQRQLERPSSPKDASGRVRMTP